MKYYAVKEGRKTGIFTSWDECKKQIVCYSNAKYKSFSTIEDAELYIKGNENNDFQTELIAYVDGSFNEQLGKYAYGCVILKNDKILCELSGALENYEYIEMRNVAGELEATKQAINWAINNKASSIRIIHDYEGIASWADGTWSANKKGTQDYVNFIKDKKKNIQIEFTKVKGHSGNQYNELADQLAKAGFDKDNCLNYSIEYIDFCKKASLNSKVSINVNGVVFSEKMLVSFAKQILKLQGNKKVTINNLQYNVGEGTVDIVFSSLVQDGKKIKIKIM